MKKTTSGGRKKAAAAGNVSEYLAAFPPKQRAALRKLRSAIKAAAPKARESISYSMPYYSYLGRLVYFAGFKNHNSLFVLSFPLMKALGKELKPFHTSGVTVHFAPEKPLPVALVKKIIKARIKENELRARRKK
jgi:uncharacterized protein YdhG (YjbR/CyaY superfamily)